MWGEKPETDMYGYEIVRDLWNNERIKIGNDLYEKDALGRRHNINVFTNSRVRKETRSTSNSTALSGSSPIAYDYNTPKKSKSSSNGKSSYNSQSTNNPFNIHQLAQVFSRIGFLVGIVAVYTSSVIGELAKTATAIALLLPWPLEYSQAVIHHDFFTPVMVLAGGIIGAIVGAIVAYLLIVVSVLGLAIGVIWALYDVMTNIIA